jgi:hypothetical protein
LDNGIDADPVPVPLPPAPLLPPYLSVHQQHAIHDFLDRLLVAGDNLHECTVCLEKYYGMPLHTSGVETHCLFGSSGALFLTRTRVLKAEPEEHVGEDCEEVTNNEQGEDAKDINDGQGQSCAGQSNEDKTEISVYK